VAFGLDQSVPNYCSTMASAADISNFLEVICETLTTSASGAHPFLGLQSEVDIGLEDEVARNPYSVKSWLAYTDAKSSAAPAVRYSVYERSLRLMPGSYKLWVAYLSDRQRQVRDLLQASCM